nr:unnamed protein product [Callosobruchus chinensis]
MDMKVSRTAASGRLLVLGKDTKHNCTAQM